MKHPECAIDGHLEATSDIAYNSQEARIELERSDCLVSINSLLEELVSSVEGASGAIVLETDGEAVQWYAGADGDRLRLRGAYIAVVLKALRGATESAGLGNMSRLVLGYEGSSFVVQEIDRDCFLAVQLNRSANIGLALYRTQESAAKLRREIAD